MNIFLTVEHKTTKLNHNNNKTSVTQAKLSHRTEFFANKQPLQYNMHHELSE